MTDAAGLPNEDPTPPSTTAPGSPAAAPDGTGRGQGPARRGAPQRRVPPPRPVRRSSWPSAIMGGLLGGGLVAAWGSWYVQTQPFVPPGLLTRIQSLEQSQGRLDALASQTGSLQERSQATASGIGSVQARLAALEQATAPEPARAAALEQAIREERARLDETRAALDAVGGDARGRADELRARVDALAGQMAQVAKASGDMAAAGQQLGALADAQGKLGGRVEQVAGAFDQLRGEVQAIDRRTAEVRDAVGQQVARLGNDVLAVVGRQDQLQGVVAATAAVQQALGARGVEVAQAREAVDALARELDRRTVAVRQATEQELAGTRQAVEQALAGLKQDVDGQVAALGQQSQQALAQAQAQVVERGQAVQRAGALALAAYDLRVALDRGGSVAPTADLVRRNAGGDAEIGQIAAGLDGAAGQDVPTLAALADGLDGVRSAFVAPPPPQDAAARPGGWAGLAGANLGSVLKVRPSSEVPSTPADQAVAAARDALAKGDLAAARGAVEPLAAVAGPGAEATKAWLASLDRRQAVAAAAERLAASLQSRLASR